MFGVEIAEITGGFGCAGEGDRSGIGRLGKGRDDLRCSWRGRRGSGGNGHRWRNRSRRQNRNRRQNGNRIVPSAEGFDRDARGRVETIGCVLDREGALVKTDSTGDETSAGAIERLGISHYEGKKGAAAALGQKNASGGVDADFVFQGR